MIAVATVDLNYGLSYEGKPLLKLATQRRQDAKMFRGNAVVMSASYFDINGVWPDKEVFTIVVDDSDDSFFKFDYSKKDVEIQQVIDPQNPDLRYYVAPHINAIYQYEHETGNVAYVLGDGHLFTKILPHCKNVRLTVIDKEFENVDDWFPDYIKYTEVEHAFSVRDIEGPKSQFKTEYSTYLYENTRCLKDPYESIYKMGCKRIVAIIGPTASGKDTIANKLAMIFKSKDLKKICSFTDRPRRDGEKDGGEHEFISSNMAQFYLDWFDDFIIAKTQISKPGSDDGYRYFSLLNDDEKNLYVIDPNGIEDLEDTLTKLYADVKIMKIYIATPKIVRYFRARKRPGFDKEVYNRRVEAEAYQFEAFEERIHSDPTDTTYVFKNFGFGCDRRFEELVQSVGTFVEG